MKLPEFCTNCNCKLSYISDIHFMHEKDPLQARIEGVCFNCGTVIYSNFLMISTEVVSFDDNGEENYIEK